MTLRRWAAGAGILVLTGAIGACGNADPDTDAASASTPASGVESPTTSPPGATPSATPGGSEATDDKLLSGTRRITIVRTEGFESGLSLLDGGNLAEVDDDSGRQVFVPTPLDGGTFQIKAYQSGGTGSPVCWQVTDAQPAKIEGATCAADEQKQQLNINKAEGAEGLYYIGHGSATLQHSSTEGLVVVDSGDDAVRHTFRFNDTGAAPEQG
ncbi:hypothetical protein [Micromonospora yangpuensis]|uniref:Uncharacterized protein n=1 Tax=Micromonospora yangpuensis TaxID=683228 RepID=A0A1C6U8D3_9ACTN|nr:hypothetical protein [Micromonospora yangpuensis]GGL89533.1 hypothetical protein GCM10012279_03960 [Micromonospora yangpuensis]SCL50234.1 hypothetical protein GA0070617_1420 [Micromonospora yangpuensis]